MSTLLYGATWQVEASFQKTSHWLSLAARQLYITACNTSAAFFVLLLACQALNGHC